MQGSGQLAPEAPHRRDQDWLDLLPQRQGQPQRAPKRDLAFAEPQTASLFLASEVRLPSPSPIWLSCLHLSQGPRATDAVPCTLCAWVPSIQPQRDRRCSCPSAI